MRKHMVDDAQIAHANRLALLAGLTIVVLPVVTLICASYIFGFSERNMSDNVLLLILIFFMPMDWALGRLMNHPWWDQFHSWWLSRKNRENYGKSVLFAFVFALSMFGIEAEHGQTLWTALAEFPIFVIVFAAASLGFDWLGLQWRRYRSHRKSKPRKPMPD